MTKEDLKQRFKSFALRVIKLADAMPHTVSGWALAKQIVRSGTSPSANYRAACIAKSESDFLNKLKIVEEEIDETTHWLEIIMEGELLPKHRVEPLYNESIELTKIISSSIVSTKKHMEEKIVK